MNKNSEITLSAVHYIYVIKFQLESLLSTYHTCSYFDFHSLFLVKIYKSNRSFSCKAHRLAFSFLPPVRFEIFTTGFSSRIFIFLLVHWLKKSDYSSLRHLTSFFEISWWSSYTGSFFKNVIISLLLSPLDTGRKLNVYQTFRRRTGRLLNVLWTFNLRPVSTGKILIKSGVLSLALGEISLSILKDENLQGRKKPIFSIYSLMKLLEDNVPYRKLNLWNRLTDSKVQRGI